MQGLLVHELALMESVVETVLEQIGEQRVAVVRLEIGELAGVAADALAFGFDVCARGTRIEGAVLDIVEIAGRARCHSCHTVQPYPSYGAPCPCGSFDRELVNGDELRLKEVEVL
jgi:hydrogenase nickel incorporation protein HypA/HybF